SPFVPLISRLSPLFSICDPDTGMPSASKTARARLSTSWTEPSTIDSAPRLVRYTPVPAPAAAAPAARHPGNPAARAITKAQPPRHFDLDSMSSKLSTSAAGCDLITSTGPAPLAGSGRRGDVSLRRGTFARFRAGLAGRTALDTPRAVAQPR